MRIVLLGGGLGHIKYIRDKAKNLSNDVEIILIAPKPHVFYVPAFEDVLTGRRQIHDAVIDLRKVATLAGVTFIQADIESVDTEKKLIKLHQRASIQFDFLSIEGVEVPRSIPAAGFAAAHIVMDFLEFFKVLAEVEEKLEQSRPSHFNVAVIGGGELAVSLSRHVPEAWRRYSPRLGWEIFESNDVILSNYQPQIRRRLEQDLKSRDVLLRTSLPVQNLDGGRISDPADPKRVFEVDLALIAAGSVLPEWIATSGLTLTSDGFLDAHPNLTLKNIPFVVASGAVLGKRLTDQDIEDHSEAIVKIASQQPIASKKAFNKVRKKDTYLLADKALQVKWGFLKESEKVFQERQTLMKASLEHLRALKEQKKAQLYPIVEENAFVDKLKKRLVLDIPEKALPALFSESLGEIRQIDGWFEKEYKDVFNDHYLSSYHMGLDLLDQSFIHGGVPEYIRLYISAPSQIKDVEILSQIIVGAYRACENRVNLKIHICGQAMNTVQFSMGAKTGERVRRVPQPTAYIALTQPLGLYGLLSQQGKSIWEGQWLSEIWPYLSQSHQIFSQLTEEHRSAFSVFQLSEQGLVNDLVKNLGSEGWRICLNLSQLPRWDGIDQILKQRPMDQLIDKNWQKGFRYWSGHGEKFPESQYLLWEPHLIRPSACLLINPHHCEALEKELWSRFQQKLHFIGYADQTPAGQQTFYKLSDWTFEANHLAALRESNLTL